MKVDDGYTMIETETCKRGFEISMGWQGCCDYEYGTISLKKEVCQELINELQDYIDKGENI